MINLAVFNLKDIGKYLIKIAIMLIILWCIGKGILSNELKQIDFSSKIDISKFLNCLDITIPGIKQVNKKESIEEDIQRIDPIKAILETQLAMMYNTKKNEEILPNNVNEIEEEKLEQAQVGLQTQVIENNVPNKFTNEYNGVKVKNETRV